MRKIEVDLEKAGGQCKADIDGPRKLKKSDKDVAVFTFSNACDSERSVLLCSISRPGTPRAPWRHCAGVPSGNPADATKPFNVPKDTSEPLSAHALCTVDWPAGTSFQAKAYCLYVVNGTPGATLSCDPPPAKCFSRGELALEVEP